MALPSRVFAHASPLSVGGRALFDRGKGPILSRGVRAFSSPAGVIALASARLRMAGFEVLKVTRYTINIAGPPDLYKTAFQRDLVEEEVALPNGGTSTCLKVPETDTPRLVPVDGTSFEDILEGVALEVPRSIVQVSALPPLASYWHLRAPGDVALGVNALATSQAGDYRPGDPGRHGGYRVVPAPVLRCAQLQCLSSGAWAGSDLS